MWDWLSQPSVQAALSVAVLLVVVYGAIQVVSCLRAATCKADINEDDLAKNFQEMRLEGDIDDVELRKIMSVLGKSQESRTGNGVT